MEIIKVYGNGNPAFVYVAKIGDNENHLIELVESKDPYRNEKDKYVFNISTQIGCPVGCKMCDTGKKYYRNLSTYEILEEISFLLNRKYPDGRINTKKFKIHFARMGEPALNNNVLDVLVKLPNIIKRPFIPCIATTAPRNCKKFFNELLGIKNSIYTGGYFQLQFSINSTDESTRDKLMPIDKFSLEEISDFGEKWFRERDRKMDLNFACSTDSEIDIDILKNIFDPKKFLVKLTPINETFSSKENDLVSLFEYDNNTIAEKIAEDLRKYGFEVIISISTPEELENHSSCGQAVLNYNISKSGFVYVEE